ncbi:MAG: GH92 family glycosyl hydrolase [Chloroflexota bacterium]|nr:GH92 family glycosyl hydrolase [Chloroflexota bacterium]
MEQGAKSAPQAIHEIEQARDAQPTMPAQTRHVRPSARGSAGQLTRRFITGTGLLTLTAVLLVELLTAALVLQDGLYGVRGIIPAQAASRAASATSSASQPASQLDLTRYVNPFVGTAAGGENWGLNASAGDTFPGAAVPFGMTQLSPDTVGGSMRAGGYGYTDQRIRGFSLTHLSGAGCAIFGDIPFMPTSGSVADAFASASYSHRDESASPGAYSVRLGNGVSVALTATTRTGFAQARFPAGATETVALQTGTNLRGVQAARAQIVSPSEVEGYVTGGQLCYFLNTTYTVYFDAQFSRPATSFGAWRGGAEPGARVADGAGSGVYLRFAPSADQTLLLKVGISYVSEANARANLHAENPGWNFASVRAAANSTWNTLLNRVQATGGSARNERTFYTALYHALLAPTVFSDVNGQYPGFDGKLHTATGYTQYAGFSGWDIYRSEVPLLALLAPLRASDMMQSLVNDGEQAGALPRWPLANSETGIMIGDSSAVILAEGLAFGAGKYDTAAALRLALAGATRPGIGAGGSTERSGLSAYLRLGYVPLDSGAWVPVSNSLEYYSDDYAIACLANDLGQPATARQFAARAANWRKIFNPATGYPQPRNSAGAFPQVAPTDSDVYIEGDAAQYTWMTPFDGAGLTQLLGGPAAAQRRLGAFFTQLNAGPSSPYANMGNEPSFGAPWMYDFMGAPGRTQATVRRIETQLYLDTPSGLPGNDDLGTMSAWYVWAALGLYPLLPGRAGFVLGSPLFPHVTLTIGSHVVRLEAPGAAPDAPYIQSMALDGAPTSQLWLPLETLEQTRAITYAMSTKPSAWGTAAADAPPSLSTERWPPQASDPATDDARHLR